MPTVFALAMELTPFKHRGQFVNLVAWNWMTGSLYLALTAYLLLSGVKAVDEGGQGSPMWRVFAAVSAAPAILATILCYFFVPESPRCVLLVSEKSPCASCDRVGLYLVCGVCMILRPHALFGRLLPIAVRLTVSFMFVCTCMCESQHATPLPLHFQIFDIKWRHQAGPPCPRAHCHHQPGHKLRRVGCLGTI